MFTRLYGETDEQQIAYLKNKSIIMIVSLILAIFFRPAGLLAAIMVFVWGWGAVKALFGITSLAAIFSGNIVIGSAFFVLYIMLSSVIGMFCAALGIGRYIYLLIKHRRRAAE